MQSVPTAFNPENCITPFGILPSVCNFCNFSENGFLCPVHVIPIMYSSSFTLIDTIKSGGMGQSFPFSFIEQCSGNNTLCLLGQNIKFGLRFSQSSKWML